MSLEYRPRAEYRKGYRSLPEQDSDAAFFISHRARINIDFKNEKFLFHTTLQDIRVWGDTDPRDDTGKAQFYEFYVEPSITHNLSVRVGRQRIMYDNQRLFAENNWRQAGGQHDAVRFIYKKEKLNVDLIGAYNQNQASETDISYDVDWDIYRAMAANFIKYKANKNLTLTAINIADEYTDPSTNNIKGYWKSTNGGRVTYQKNKLTYTLASYYQWGKIENGKQHSAYYIEPELTWKKSDKYSVKFGAQIFSGDKDKTDQKSTSFLAQYGAFHRHNGGMDYTQKTVRTNEHEGIINPYIMQDFTFFPKFSLNWQSHLLGSQTQLTKTVNTTTQKLDRFYAWENDFRFFYKPNKYTKIEFSHLFLIPTNSISAIDTGKDGDTNKIAQFTYLAISWTPNLLNIRN
ncbi:hypothetical protein FHR24_001416 [Wenyingzhuangia heitensis]|uniref:Alginate export domain-containing protein n=1 Tax=Wenyingzhuangia heitensis TaxID=1487859 RepID=A0ABX0U802_9FLAO|nr:alginate export family protein [Wenyingzhuangia heitensis]NIJ44977.1 hypothetical protein [Wenyingzhuangia heitensis]